MDFNSLFSKRKLNISFVSIGILVTMILVPYIFSSNNSITEIREELDVFKSTKITLLDETTLKIETIYRVILKKGDLHPPIITINSDAIRTQGKLKNVMCKLNNTPVKWEILNIEELTDWKHVALFGDMTSIVGKISEFYISYEIDTSALYNIGGYIGCEIALYTPKVEKEIFYKYDLGVYSNLQDWQPYNPFYDIIFDKSVNYNVFTSSIIKLSNGGGFKKVIEPVHFQKKGFMDITKWEQYLIIEPSGDLVQKYYISGDCPLNALRYDIPLHYNGENPSLNVTFILKNGDKKTAISYGSLINLREIMSEGGFGYIFVSSEKVDYVIIAANHPELKRFELQFESTHPNYKYFQEVSPYTYELKYSPLFDPLVPDEYFKVIFEISDNFFVEKCNYNPIESSRSSLNPHFMFKSGEGPFDGIVLVFSNNVKKNIDSLRDFNHILIILMLGITLLPIVSRKIKTKFMKEIILSEGILPTFSLIITFAISYSNFVDIKRFLIDSHSHYVFISFIIVTIIILYLDKLNQKKKRHKSKKLSLP